MPRKIYKPEEMQAEILTSEDQSANDAIRQIWVTKTTFYR